MQVSFAFSRWKRSGEMLQAGEVIVRTSFEIGASCLASAVV